MRSAAILALASTATAFPTLWRRQANETTPNPFEGRKLYANPDWAEKLEVTKAAFLERGDTINAAKVTTVQNTGTFVWISQIAQLPNIDLTIERARAIQKETGEKQIVGLVLYNLPDRDCSAGESAGELKIDEDGLARYKSEYVDEWASRLSGADDLVFAVVMEPDAVGNMVTNQGMPACAKAKETQEEGIAYAISKLQSPNIHLYLDASHGGWLGWNDNLPLTAKQFAAIVQKSGNSTRVRGFSTNVSNYNPFHANPRENYTEWNNSWDENHYALSLAPHLEEAGLPSRFIVDQGRVHLPGARKEWGEWCNIRAGFGQPPTTQTNNTHVDSIVWIKPGGESDGECGMEGATRAGVWFDEYAQMLVENAHPDLVGTSE